jgi:hypothetical protein
VKNDVLVIYCSGNAPSEDRQVKGSLFLPKPCRIDLLLHAANASGSSTPNGSH